MLATVALVAITATALLAAEAHSSPGRSAVPAPVSLAATSNPGNNSNSSGSTNLTYSVSFLASGLPAGTSWTVLLGSRTATSAGSEVTFSGVPGGPVQFWVSAPSGYSASPSSGTVTVQNDYRQLVSFSSTASSSPSWSEALFSTEGELVLGILAAGAIAVTLNEWRERRGRRRRDGVPPERDPAEPSRGP